MILRTIYTGAPQKAPLCAIDAVMRRCRPCTAERHYDRWTLFFFYVTCTQALSCISWRYRDPIALSWSSRAQYFFCFLSSALVRFPTVPLNYMVRQIQITANCFVRPLRRVFFFPKFCQHMILKRLWKKKFCESGKNV